MVAKNILALTLGLSLFYSGCSGDCPPEGPNGSGGNTAGAGGNTAGTGGEENTGGYPGYINSTITHTSPEVMDLVNCIIEKNKELQGPEPTMMTRTGIVMMGAERCYDCQEERNEIGLEGVVKLAVNGIYIDPSFNYASELKAQDVGWQGVPSIAVMMNDIFPTADNPDGIETLLKRQREGFDSLQTLADLTGCTYNP